MERPNNTIYINNLNEKVKKDGKLYIYSKGSTMAPLSINVSVNDLPRFTILQISKNRFMLYSPNLVKYWILLR